MYPGSYIEVGLKGVPAPAPRAKMSLGSNSNDMSVASNSEQLLVLIDEFDKKKKERNKLKTDYESKRQTNDAKINQIYTALENVKNDLKDQTRKSEQSKQEAE
jgi:hypothetical protein